jgi:hypothetical protein
MIIDFPTRNKLDIDNNEDLGNVIVLLGTAGTGPVLEPVRVISPEHAVEVFGNKGSLYDYYTGVYGINQRAVYYLVRITGSHATAVLKIFSPEEDNVIDGLKLMAVDGSAAYNSVQAGFEAGEDGQCLFIEEAGRKNTYSLSECVTLGLLVSRINQNARRKLSKIVASTSYSNYPSTSLLDNYSGPIEFSGGSDGLDADKTEMYYALGRAYEFLNDRRTDIVVPLGVYFNDVIEPSYYGNASYGQGKYSSKEQLLNLEVDGTRCTFHGQLLDFCECQMSIGCMAHGVLAMRPLPEPDKMPDPVEFGRGLVEASCLNSRYHLSTINQGNIRDRGCNISIVCGDILYPDGRLRTGAAGYAATIAACGMESTTNVPVNGIVGQQLQFSSDVRRYLSDNGLVSFRHSVKNGIVVANGVTAATTDSSLHFLSNIRTVQYVLARLKAATDIYIGEGFSFITAYDILNRTIEEVLNDIVSKNHLQWYSFKLKLTRSNTVQVSFVATVDLELRPKYSVEDIIVTVQIVRQEWGNVRI